MALACLASVSILALVTMLTVAPARAQQPSPAVDNLERSVKAAFLYQFARFAEWPAAALGPGDAALVIGILGSEETATELQRIVKGRSIGSRPLAVRRLKEGEPPAGVHLLFIGAMDRARLSAAIKAAQQRPVLVVTESEGALGLGSAINFVLVDGRVRFEVAQGAAERNGLKLSSRMLAVALNVQRPGGS
jgi:hypothetical protein